MKKLGVLGGTFNPVHYGHLRTAIEVFEHFEMDNLLFIPTYIPPHKMRKDIVAPELRLKMLELAIKDFPYFKVDDMEITRKEISYSIDTVRALKEKNDARIYFILGADAFCELRTWNNYKELLFLCDFVVMTRPTAPEVDIKKIFPPEIFKRFRYDKIRNVYESDTGTNIFYIDVTPLDISSTNIRKLIREGKSIKYLLPKDVEEYILSNGLYK